MRGNEEDAIEPAEDDVVDQSHFCCISGGRALGFTIEKRAWGSD